MKALSAQMMFLVILYIAKQRNAGVDRQLILPLQVVIPALLRLLLPLLFLPLARQQPQPLQLQPLRALQLQPPRLQPQLQRLARQQPQPLQLQPRRQPGTGVLVNTLDIVLFQIALKPTYVSAEGRSAMDMETPGPPQNKWMKSLSAQTRFLVILFFAKQRNASVNRQLHPHGPGGGGLLQRLARQQSPQLQPRRRPALQQLPLPQPLRALQGRPPRLQPQLHLHGPEGEGLLQRLLPPQLQP